jgi:hypothetical protein
MWMHIQRGPHNNLLLLCTYVCMYVLIIYLQFRKLHSCKFKGHSQYAYHCKNVVFILTIWETLQNANSMWIHNNYMKESVLNMFLCSYFEYFQIWPNICMHDGHFSNITKLPLQKKKKQKPLMRLQLENSKL